jgi:hypothetical protein
MPKTPASDPQDSPQCDIRLPTEALEYRRRNGLIRPPYLGSINVTAWLYRDANGEKKIQVNPNIPISDLIKEYGPAETPDAEVGIHSEQLAGQWFVDRPQLRVLQIFSERIPCPKMCAPMLRHYFPGVPWYYYYDRRSWLDPRGRVISWPAEILAAAYGL